MVSYTSTSLGTLTIGTNGAFVTFQWNDGALHVRAFNPRYVVGGIDNKDMWVVALTERQSTPANQPFSTEFGVTFNTLADAVAAGTDFMTACATALLAGGRP